MNPLKQGDNGITANLDGSKISKNSPRIHLIGDLDELNSYLGLVKVKIKDENDKIFLEKTQLNLVKLMSHVSDSDNEKYFFTESETAELENEIARLQDTMPKQTDFVLPGRNETEAFIQIARTAARRAERCFVSAIETTQLNPHCGSFLNKLSFYLFLLSIKVSI